MSTPVKIVDEDGNTPKVVERGLVISQTPSPAPAQSSFIQIPFVKNLSTDGSGLGLPIDLSLVDGSVDPIDAFIGASSEGDIYLKSANLFIEASGNIQLQDFGSISSGLTNGIDTFIENEAVKFPITQIPIKTNLDMIRIGTLTPSLGEDSTAFRGKQTIAGGNTFYNPIWDLTRLAGGFEGIRLTRNTNQRIGITINDDLTSLVSFNIIMTGYLRLVN